MQNKYKENARIFKAFCDENRLRILELLQNGEKCACNLLEELPIGQSTLSHHMKILIDSGVVTGRKEGKWTHYTLSDTGCELAKNTLSMFLRRTEQNDMCKVLGGLYEDNCYRSCGSRNFSSCKSKKK